MILSGTPINLENDGALIDDQQKENCDRAALRLAAGGANFKPLHESYGRHSVHLHVTLE